MDGKEVTKEMIGDANFAKLEAISNGAKRNTANGSNFQNITCRKVDYSDRPCYLLIYKYNTDDGLFTNEEIIDRNTFLTYQIQTFAPSGKLTSKIIYTDIVINPIFEKDFFELPRGTTVVVAKTLKDANRESSIALDKVSPPPLSKKHPFSVSTWTNQFGSRIVNTFGNNVSILSYIFATIAILILVSVIITKVEKHQ